MFNTIKTALETVPALKNKVKPLGMSLTATKPPVGAYTVEGPEPYRALGGKVHHYSMDFTLDILAKTFDECQSIYEACIEAVAGITTEKTVFRLECTSDDADAAVPELDLMRKRLVISVDWR